MRERGITQASLGAVVGRATSYVHGVLSGYWVPDAAFITTVSDHLDLPRETLFTDRLLEVSERPGDEIRPADDAKARLPAAPGETYSSCGPCRRDRTL